LPLWQSHRGNLVMTSPTSINLARRFQEHQQDDDDVAYSSYGVGLQEEHAINWGDIFRHPVTLVTGQAGSGKTSELRLEERSLRDQAHSALFPRLETIATRGLDAAL